MAGKYQAYPEYQDSGIDWIGPLPAQWKVVRVKHLFTIRKQIAGELGYDILSITQKGVKVKDIESGEGQLSMDYSKYQRVMPGDFAMNHMDLLTGYVDISSYDGVTSPDYRVFAINGEKNDPRFFLYLFQMGYQQRIFYHMGQGASHLGRWRLATDEFNNLSFPVPCPQEQRNIAAFLNHETARIDRLIEKQQRLIELLKEKRQAVISHAVTKGIDPNVPMKDSGVEWLGQVPEHWAVTRAKMVSEIFVPQRNKPELNDSGDGLHWATMEDMKSDAIDETRKYVSQEAFEAAGSKVLTKGAVVASCVGNFGIASVLNIDVVINQQLQAYIPKAISGPYLRDVITCSKVYFDLVGTAATLVYVNQEGFGNLPIPLPPMVEQREIERHIDLSKAKLDRAIAKGQQQVSLLQERRTALISAAVTGKIDVRNWQLNTSTQAAESDLPMAAEQAAEYRV